MADAAAAAGESPPVRLSAAGIRAVLGEAAQRARETDVLGPLAGAVDQPGFRRRTLAEFAAWTRGERRVDGPPPGPGAVEAARWALFGHFREVLGEIGAETPEGFAAWASRRLADAPPSGWRNLDDTLVAVVEPLAPSKAIRRACADLAARAGAVLLTLPFDPEPALAEVYAAVEPTRRHFLAGGFVEEAVAPAEAPGMGDLDRELFRADAHARPPLGGAGLRIQGGPKGEGEALLIARTVREALAAGTRPDDVLILLPREDDDAALLRSTLAAWGLPVAPGPGRRLANTPAVTALRLAIRLPVEGWPTATLVRLVRNGAIAWDRLGLADPAGRFEAAAAIQGTRVHRRLDHLRRALGRPRPDVKAKGDVEAHGLGLDAINRLADRLDVAARPGPWRVQLGRLRTLAQALGLDDDELDPLWDALEDHAWVLDQVGPAIAAEPVRWADLVARVERIVAEAEPPAPCPLASAGGVRVEVVGAVDAARADLVILAHLAERTYPAPGSVPLEPARTAAEPVAVPPAAEDATGLAAGDDPVPADPIDAEADPATTEHTELGYAREMLRFARALASADRSLTLSYPTTDVTGETLLPAGFLDEILRRLDPAGRPVEAHARFDPVFRGHEELARATGDARVLAVAQARAGDLGPLRRLAARPAHAEACRGVAEAFVVGQLRRERFDFGGHDGWLMDPAAVARVAASFAPEKHTFSPSQLESYAYCPFQFFQRYVLNLRSNDGVEELAEDYAARGKDVHGVLEEVHRALALDPDADLATHLPISIETHMAARLDDVDRDAPPGEADVAAVLREIDTRRSARALERYLAQFRAYRSKAGLKAVPSQFEVKFGQQEKDPGSLDHLTLGDGDRAIRLQGVIDRIDLVRDDDGTRFRVIDYKTGSNPTDAQVRSGLASQLPLYAMAVERLVLPSGGVAFLDAGYWSLPKDGFKGVKLHDWDDYRARMIDFVLDMVAELRRGVFPIFSQEANCHQFCDFHRTCRVREVRVARKAWNDRPTLEVLKP